MGIPIDHLRRLSFVLGPRLVFTQEGIGDRTTFALLAGVRAGLRYKTTGDIGFHSTLFGEGGGVGFTNAGKGELGVAPYIEGGASVGINLGDWIISAEGAMGKRKSALPGETELQDHYRLGITFTWIR